MHGFARLNGGLSERGPEFCRGFGPILNPGEPATARVSNRTGAGRGCCSGFHSSLSRLPYRRDRLRSDFHNSRISNYPPVSSRRARSCILTHLSIVPVAAIPSRIASICSSGGLATIRRGTINRMATDFEAFSTVNGPSSWTRLEFGHHFPTSPVAEITRFAHFPWKRGRRGRMAPEIHGWCDMDQGRHDRQHLSGDRRMVRLGVVGKPLRDGRKNILRLFR